MIDSKALYAHYKVESLALDPADMGYLELARTVIWENGKTITADAIAQASLRHGPWLAKRMKKDEGGNPKTLPQAFVVGI